MRPRSASSSAVVARLWLAAALAGCALPPDGGRAVNEPVATSVAGRDAEGEAVVRPAAMALPGANEALPEPAMAAVRRASPVRGKEIAPALQPTLATDRGLAAQPALDALALPLEVPLAAPPPMPRQAFHAPLPAFGDDAPAMRLANLSEQACRHELAQRKLAFEPAERAASGIAVPVRVTGPVRGVRFVTARAPSPFGLLDCRLALALDELAGVLEPLGVREVNVGSMYREGAHIAHRPGRRSQHSYGLAADVVSLRLASGELLQPEHDWHAAIGDAACGPDAVMATPDARAIALRDVYCAVARSRIFHHMLGPSANQAHRDHLHFDLQRDTRYRSVD